MEGGNRGDRGKEKTRGLQTGRNATIRHPVTFPKQGMGWEMIKGEVPGCSYGGKKSSEERRGSRGRSRFGLAYSGSMKAEKKGGKRTLTRPLAAAANEEGLQISRNRQKHSEVIKDK